LKGPKELKSQILLAELFTFSLCSFGLISSFILNPDKLNIVSVAKDFLNKI